MNKSRSLGSTYVKDSISIYEGQLAGKVIHKGLRFINDNRMSQIHQRKLKESINGQGIGSSPLVKPGGSARFQQIATSMGSRYGVDTSNLVAKHNSSFPATLNAEATIQGKNIHFAPGKDTDYNIRHEVAHAIDNTLNGTPNGDFRINGHLIDASRESKVDQMANNQRLPASDYSINHNTLKTDSENKVFQRTEIGSGRPSKLNLKKRSFIQVIQDQKAALREKLGSDEEYEHRVIELKDKSTNSACCSSFLNCFKKGYYVFRTSKNLTLEQCRKIVDHGQVLKRQEENIFLDGNIDDYDSDFVKMTIDDNKQKWNGLSDEEKAAMLFQHKSGALTDELATDDQLRNTSETLIKSTSKDEKLLYNVKKGEYFDKEDEEYTLVTIIELKDDDIAYDVSNLSDAFKNEAEISVIGGVRPESIIWAAAVLEVDN